MTGQALAQVPTPVTNTDFSKETENPVTRQITLPLRYQADFLDGADRFTKSTFELDQAVVPFRLNGDWSLITRTKLPAEALPPKKAGDSWAEGLSNGYTTFFLSPEHGRGFYWGAGPVLYYPATNSMLGATKWGSGPSVAFIHEEGGQRQRVGIARAVVLRPDFVLADEIVSGLDVSTKAQVLRLLKELTSEMRLALAFISHDLSVVRSICQRVVVMCEGRVAEEGPCDRLFAAPGAAYTRTLIDAIPLPVVDPGWLSRGAALARPRRTLSTNLLTSYPRKAG